MARPAPPHNLNGQCDNQEPFDDTAGVGTPTENPSPDNPFEECESDCGSSWVQPCLFQFRVTKRYAGDNYRVYYYEPGGSGLISSAIVTAWKRAYIENDGMCRVGGQLYADPGREPDAQATVDAAVLVAKEWDEPTDPPQPAGWYRRDNLQADQLVHIFDTVNTYEGPHDVAYACETTPGGLGQPYVIVTLGTAPNMPGDPCIAHPYYLQHNYNGGVPTPAEEHPVWDFALPAPPPPPAHQGRGGGLCAEPADPLFLADPSELNRRDDRTGTFDDAFVSFALPPEGSGVVPYLPEEWFGGHDPNIPPDDHGYDHFSHLWFAHRPVDAMPPPDYPSQNYYHLVGASSSPSAFGIAPYLSDVAYVFVSALEEDCSPPNLPNPAPDVPTCITNSIRDVTNHEMAHQYEVNWQDVCAGSPMGRGHDPIPPSNLAWCSGEPGCIDPNPIMTETRCLMSGATDDQQQLQRHDLIHRMECEDLGVPRPPCTEDDCGYGVRNQADPQ